MIAAPAVDLRGGRCVQLVGGVVDEERISLMPKAWRSLYQPMVEYKRGTATWTLDKAKQGGAWAGEAWKKVGAQQNGPPRMKQGAICHDPKRDLLVVGPGFHEGDPGGREAQRVFFVGCDGEGMWERQGVTAEDSPLARLHYHRRYFIAKDAAHATRARRTLHTFAWRDGACAWTRSPA